MKIRLLIAGLLFSALAVSGCGFASSKVNEACLVYSGGIIEDKDFKKFLKPGATNSNIGYGSSTYCYKIDQRTYIAGTEEGVDTGPVEVVSNDDVRLNVEYQLYFTLNQEENVLRKFHENLGIKTEAWKTEGWRELLKQYFEPQIERSLEAAALKQNWRDLYASEEARLAFEVETISTIKRNINEIVGDEYFCGPQYTGDNECGNFTFKVGKPYPVNKDIVKAVEAEQTAVSRTLAQEQENARIAAQVAGEKALVDLYGAETAAWIKVMQDALEKGNVPFLGIPTGGSVAIPAP